MTKPVSDKAQVTIEYPDKFYSGTFERSSRFEVSFDATRLLLLLEHPGSEDVRKSVHIHINYGLFSDILQESCLQVPNIPKDEILSRTTSPSRVRIRTVSESSCQPKLRVTLGGTCARSRQWRSGVGDSRASLAARGIAPRFSKGCEPASRGARERRRPLYAEMVVILAEL